jgi:hypothetical protein
MPFIPYLDLLSMAFGSYEKNLLSDAKNIAVKVDLCISL